MRRSKLNLNLFLLMFIMLILIGAVATTAYAAEVTVSLPTFDVTMNGVEIEDEYRQYPFIVYKDITYFPMTYFDSRFLGLVTGWDNLKGLEIYKTTETVEYEPYKQNWKNSNKYAASIPKFNIVVNGKAINNSTEKYPLLSFRNVSYFPMTWRFAVDEFGWKYSFTSEDGLIINSTPPTLYADLSDNQWPLIFDRTFKIVDDIISMQIKSYRIAYSSKLYISINGEEQRQLGDNKYVYGVTTYRDIDNNIGMKSNYYMEIKDGWLYINAYNYQEENSSRLYKVNIKTGETVPVVESDDFIIGETANGLNSGDINMTDYEKLLIYTYLKYIQNASDDFYKEYFTINPTVTYDYIWVKEIRVDGSTNPTSYITFTCIPFVGAHLSVGIDEITFSTDYVGNIELKEFKNIKNYSLPEHLKSLIIKPIPGEYEPYCLC